MVAAVVAYDILSMAIVVVVVVCYRSSRCYGFHDQAVAVVAVAVVYVVVCAVVAVIAGAILAVVAAVIPNLPTCLHMC